MESTRLGINNETIDSLNSFALTLYKIIVVITEHERAFCVVLSIILLIFVYFFIGKMKHAAAIEYLD